MRRVQWCANVVGENEGFIKDGDDRPFENGRMDGRTTLGRKVGAVE